MEESFARGFGIDAHRATLHSSHPHLAVHEHGQEPVAEGGEFLVLEVMNSDFDIGSNLDYTSRENGGPLPLEALPDFDFSDEVD